VGPARPRHRRRLRLPGREGVLRDLGLPDHALLIAEHARTGRISLRDFYVRRVWRIFPAFYAFIAAMLAAWAIGWIALAPTDVLAAVTYTMNYHYERSWDLGHIWSLSIEEQFYLVWPFLFLWLGRARVVSTSIVIIVLALGCRAIAWFVLRSDNLVEEAYPCVMDSIAVGCLFAGLRERLDAWPRYLRFLRSPWFLLVPVVIAVAQLPRFPAIEYTVAATVENLGDRRARRSRRALPDDLFGRAAQRPPARVARHPVVLALPVAGAVPQPRRRDRRLHLPAQRRLLIVCALASFYLVEQPILTWRAQRAARAAAGA
jgi:peptidoglycan/LPS O-acetylase OafA/YrhL